MPVDRIDGEVLLSIYNYKLDSRTLNTWVSARMLEHRLSWTVEEIARAMRGLELVGKLEKQGRMYGSPTDPAEQRYGLTPDGATEAQYYERMKFDPAQMQLDVLNHMQNEYSKLGYFVTSGLQLSQLFMQDVGEMMRVVNELRSIGYIEAISSAQVLENAQYKLTAEGHRVASYVKREGRFPSFSSTNNVNNNTITNSQIGVAVQNSQGTVNISYAAGIDGRKFTEAAQGFTDALQEVEDEEEREEGILRANRLQKVVESGKSGQAQWNNLTSWILGLVQIVTVSAILWNFFRMIGQVLGFSIPEAPSGLGQ